MKKFIVTLLVVFMALSFVMANGAKEAEPTGPVTIELWSSLTGSKAKVFDGQVAKFNETQDEVIVNVIHQGGYDMLRQKVAAAANAKNLPTLLICDYLDVAYYAQLGVLEDVSNILSEEVIGDYYEGMLKDLTVDGVLYGIPYNRSTQGFYVNNDLLRKAGIDHIATTWDEFKEQCIQMKTLGDDYYLGYAFFHQFLFDGIAYTWGAEIATPEGEIKFLEPEMKDMFHFFQDLYNDGYLLMQPVLSGGFEEQNGAFFDGKVATVFQTTSFTSSAVTLLEGTDWSYEFTPAKDGMNAVTIGGGNFTICAGVSDSQREAAEKFLNYMSSDEIVAEFFMSTGNLPVKKSVLESDLVQEFLEKNPSYKTIVAQLDYAKAAPATTKNIRNVYNRVNDMISRIILNGEDVDTVLAEYQNEFQAEFDEMKANGTFIY
ncbi:MAG: ABC transporter substrate-binding protein [Candidatus Ornithospirochaeta sp.]